MRQKEKPVTRHHVLSSSPGPAVSCLLSTFPSLLTFVYIECPELSLVLREGNRKAHTDSISSEVEVSLALAFSCWEAGALIGSRAPESKGSADGSQRRGRAGWDPRPGWESALGRGRVQPRNGDKNRQRVQTHENETACSGLLSWPCLLHGELSGE